MPDPQGSDTIIGQGPTDTTTGDTVHPNPIGVPSAVYNPKTGQYEPWGLTRPVVGPGSHGIEGPGTATSSGVPGYEFIPPRYYGGDEIAPAGWDPNRISDLQRSMIAAGLIPTSASIRVGFWDTTSQKGFETLLGYANQTGVDWEAALSNYGRAPQQGSDRAPLTVRTTNPEDLRKVFRQTVIDTLGQGWDQAKIDQMVAAYQQVETSAQTQAYNMEPTGGTVTAPPDPGAFAESQVRQEDPTGAQAHDALGYEKQFFAALKGVVD